MTLIELLLAMMISSLIIGVVGAAFIMSIQVNKNNSRDLAESHDAQLTAAYLPADVLSIGPGGLDITVTSASSCGGGTSGTRIAEMTWSQGVGSATSWFAAEYRVIEESPEWRLIRRSCTAGTRAGLTSAAANRQVIARNLKPVITSSDLPTVTESGRVVTFRIADATGYTYSLSGTRRTPLTLTTPSTPGPLPTLTSLAPRLIALELKGSPSGAVHIEARFSATVLPTCAPNFDVTVPITRGSYTGADIPLAGSTTVRLNLTSIGQANTSADGLTVSLTESPTCVVQGFAPEIPVDLAPPVLLELDLLNAGGTAGRFEVGDKLRLLFSEDVANLPSPVAFELDGGSGNPGYDSVSIPSVLAGNASLGSTDYIEGNHPVVANGTLSQVGPAAYEASLTFPNCGTPRGSCRDSADLRQSSGGDFSWTQSAALADTTGNTMTNRSMTPTAVTVSSYEAF